MLIIILLCSQGQGGTESFHENIAFWRKKISFGAILEVCGLIASFSSAVELKSISEDLE